MTFSGYAPAYDGKVLQVPLSTPFCSVYACHDAATFVLLQNDGLAVSDEAPVDALCAEHWLQLRVFDPDRAYQFVSVRYAVMPVDESSQSPTN